MQITRTSPKYQAFRYNFATDGDPGVGIVVCAINTPSPQAYITNVYVTGAFVLINPATSVTLSTNVPPTNYVVLLPLALFTGAGITTVNCVIGGFLVSPSLPVLPISQFQLTANIAGGITSGQAIFIIEYFDGY